MAEADLSGKAGEIVAAAIDSDSELSAIRAVLSALVPLKREARTRVLDYVFKRLGLVIDAASPTLPTSAASLPTTGLAIPSQPAMVIHTISMLAISQR